MAYGRQPYGRAPYAQLLQPVASGGVSARPAPNSQMPPLAALGGDAYQIPTRALLSQSGPLPSTVPYDPWPLWMPMLSQ